MSALAICRALFQSLPPGLRDAEINESMTKAKCGSRVGKGYDIKKKRAGRIEVPFESSLQ